MTIASDLLLIIILIYALMVIAVPLVLIASHNTQKRTLEEVRQIRKAMGAATPPEQEVHV